jgi:hypothetical protein
VVVPEIVVSAHGAIVVFAFVADVGRSDGSENANDSSKKPKGHAGVHQVEELVE